MLTLADIPRSRLAIMAEIPQLDGEPADAYVALTIWIQACTPQLAELAKARPEYTAAQLQEWQRQYRWRDRHAESVYATRSEMMRVAMLERMDELALGHTGASLARSLTKQAVARLAADEALGQPCSAPLRDLAYVAKTLTEVERLLEGQSTANVAVKATVTHKPLDPAWLDSLSDEQLDAIAQAGFLAESDEDGS